MATPSHAAVLGAAGLGLLGTFGSSQAFVASPQAPSAGKHLRAAAVGSISEAGAAAGAAGGSSLLAVGAVSSVVAAIGAAALRRGSRTACRAEKGEDLAATIPRPEDLLESPKFPLFMGSTGGYMSKATRERHAITWTSKEAFQFEMPTGGFAIMNKGENLSTSGRRRCALLWASSCAS